MPVAGFDLCSLSDVRSWMSLNSGMGGNSSQSADIATTIPAGVTPGLQTVTPASMVGIVPFMVLAVDSGSLSELVVVRSTSATTFTANFANTHAPNVILEDMTDVVLGRVITAASAYILRRTGFANQDGTLPTTSPLAQPVSYNEWYDGNGNDRLFLRVYPIVSVQSLTINGTTVNPSTGWGSYGYVIDSSRKSLAFQTGSSMRSPRGYNYPWGFQTCGFSQGTQNINVQYMAGYTGTPYDLADACVKLVGFNYRRRDWQGMKQVTQPQTEGVVQYNSDWTIPPDVEEVLRSYTKIY